MRHIQITYITDDDVHQDTAGKMAINCGAAIHGRHPARVPAEGCWSDAVLYDLDAVEPDHRPALLSRILSEKRGCPTAIHGYALSDEQAEKLRRHRIAVAKRLSPELFHDLCEAARYALGSRTRRLIE
ncbi:hypothetical protein P12x_005531 [Tundrisphaera lichenicola]|uniref:hypothetical protein n=1 Tax=Tundrisphaera lichenicola TaxID=2029860 RepID=UPI003EBCE197